MRWIASKRSSVTRASVRMKYSFTDSGIPFLSREYQDKVLWLEFLATLAAVDGAVVLDGAMRVVGFGAFIKSVGETRVTLTTALNHPKTKTASALGGGRIRAAVEFCKQCAPQLRLSYQSMGVSRQ